MDLQLSWGQTVGAISGLATDPQLDYTTLNISWGTNGQNIQVMIPHTGDPYGSGVSGFTFADGSTLSMAQMIALAPPAPSFDPGLFIFRPGMGAQVMDSSYDSIMFAAGVTAGNVQFFQQGADLLITYGTQNNGTPNNGMAGDSALIQNFTDSVTGSQRIAQFRFADGSQGSYTTDGMGNASMYAYDANGLLVGDFWQGSDGYYGNDTYNVNGSSSGTNYNPDGSYRYIWTDDGHGAYTDLYYNADGSRTGIVDDGHGGSTTTNYDSSGVKLNDNWVKADGSHGVDTFNAGGSSSGSAYYADGSSSNYIDDGLGHITSTDYDANGNPINRAPLAGAALPGQSGTQDQVFNYTLPSSTFGDPDTGDMLTLMAVLSDGNPLPAG